MTQREAITKGAEFHPDHRTPAEAYPPSGKYPRCPFPPSRLQSLSWQEHRNRRARPTNVAPTQSERARSAAAAPAMPLAFSTQAATA